MSRPTVRSTSSLAAFVMQHSWTETLWWPIKRRAQRSDGHGVSKDITTTKHHHPLIQTVESSNASTPNVLAISVQQGPSAPGAAIKFKKLNSDEIKNLIMAKDDEMKRKEEAAKIVAQAEQKQHLADEAKKRKATTMVSAKPSKILMSGPVMVSPTMKVDQLPEVAKKADNLDSDDHYTPDNNSNNVINKHQINPPPTEDEFKQGYCIRQFANSQQRFICTVCGKHYTTTYNMRQHKNVHLGSGLHTCRYCGRDFTHKHVWEVRALWVPLQTQPLILILLFFSRLMNESTLENDLSNVPIVPKLLQTEATTTAIENFAPWRRKDIPMHLIPQSTQSLLNILLNSSHLFTIPFIIFLKELRFPIFF